MKTKKLLIALSIILTSITAAHSQQLANTTWAAYDTSNVFSLYWQFDNTTASYSFDNITYTTNSYYFENGNQFTIVDLPGSGCFPTDTGRYTFLIQTDTLRFTLITDPCIGRTEYVPVFYFVRLTTGISQQHAISDFSISPNPFSDKLIIKGNTQPAELSLYDIAGRKVFNQTFSGSLSVNTSQFSKGIYTYELRNNSQTSGWVSKKGKVIKE